MKLKKAKTQLSKQQTASSLAYDELWEAVQEALKIAKGRKKNKAAHMYLVLKRVTDD